MSGDPCPDVDLLAIDEQLMAAADPVLVEEPDDIVDIVPIDQIIKAPVIYSWGRCDTNTLLRSQNEPPAVDGVQALTFANQRTIMQVEKGNFSPSLEGEFFIILDFHFCLLCRSTFVF
jgi:hypothetical protein